MRSTRRLRGLFMVQMCSAVVALSAPVLGADPPTYKDRTATTGVPDIHQGDRTCDAASVADAIWWYNQTHNSDNKPLVNTAAMGWYDRSRELHTALVDKIYTKKLGFLGSLQYIYAKRPKDFIAPPKDTGAFETQWAFEYKHWKLNANPAVDLESIARGSFGDAHKFAIIRGYLHKQGNAQDNFQVPLAGGGNGLWVHSYAYAGRDYAADTPAVTTHGLFAHGWEPTHENDANPVDSTFYNKYTVSVNGASKHWRLTDNDFIGSAGGIADGTTIDYAGLNEVAMLRDDVKKFYGYKMINPSRGSSALVQHTIENNDGNPLSQIGIELPLVNPQSLGWLSSVSITGLPAGWTWSYWDPNDTPDMTPLIAMDDGGLVERGFRGILLQGSPTAQHLFELDMTIDASAVDYFSNPALGFAAADIGTDYFMESLGVPIPEPSGALLLLGVGVMLHKRRR